MGDDELGIDDDDEDCLLKIIYPFGQSIDIDPKRPNISTIFTSGKIAFPMNRPLCVVTSSKSTKGRLCVFGSINFFDNSYTFCCVSLHCVEFIISQFSRLFKNSI